MLNLLVKYGKYKGKQEEEKIYELPQSSVLNINKQCDIYVFEKYKEEYLSYIRKEGFQLKLKDKNTVEMFIWSRVEEHYRLILHIKKRMR